MPDSAAPVVRRPVRRLPSSGKEVLEAGKEFRRLSLGEASRGSSVEKEAGVGNNRVLVRRSVKVKKETALQRLMRDDDLPPPFPVSSSHVAAAPAEEKPAKAPPAAPVKSRRRVAKTCRDLELEHAVLQWIMTIVHEKPTDDYDTFIQDGSILSKVMTSIVFNSVPIETTEDNWGTNPVLDRIKTVIRELKRYGVVDVFEPEDLMELRNIPKVTKCLAQLSKLAASDKESLLSTTTTTPTTTNN